MIKLPLLPEIVLSFVWSHDAWIVGSSAAYVAGKTEKKPGDIDVLVPFQHWRKAAVLIPRGTFANSFGGFKLRAEWLDKQKTLVDIWPGDIGEYLATASNPAYAFQPATGLYLTSEKICIGDN